MLYYIHQTPLSSWRVEGGSGDETMFYSAKCSAHFHDCNFSTQHGKLSTRNQEQHIAKTHSRIEKIYALVTSNIIYVGPGLAMMPTVSLVLERLQKWTKIGR